MSTRYAVTDRPGYFGDSATVHSTHRTLDAARRAMERGKYRDECGRSRHPTCVVECGTERKGDTYYSDMFPPVLA